MMMRTKLVFPAVFFLIWLGIDLIEPRVNYQLVGMEIIYLIGCLLSLFAIAQEPIRRRAASPTVNLPRIPIVRMPNLGDSEEKSELKCTSIQNRSGYVYLLKSNAGLYKIGRTVNPNDRLYTFQNKLPFEVEYEHVIPCRNYIEAEEVLHRAFSAQNVNGEWFQLSKTDVAYIKSIEKL